MLCDSCLQELAVNLSRESRLVLAAINSPLNKAQIISKTKLGSSVVARAVCELCACCLIDYAESGRAKVYHLTKNGKRLLQLYREVSAC